MRAALPLLLMTSASVAAACGAGGVDPAGDDDPASSFAPETSAVGDTVVLEAGESVVFEGTEIELTFVSLVADSRCPTDVTCVWAGDAEALVRLSAAEGDSEVSLHTTLEPRSVPVGRWVLELIDVLPHPRTAPQTDPEAVRIVVRLVEDGTPSSP